LVFLGGFCCLPSSAFSLYKQSAKVMKLLTGIFKSISPVEKNICFDLKKRIMFLFFDTESRNISFIFPGQLHKTTAPEAFFYSRLRISIRVIPDSFYFPVPGFY